MKQSLSPRELARVVGVSESSLKRWADAGRVPFTRTAGGHRRISVPDAVRFARLEGLPVVCPEVLGLPAYIGGGPDLPEARADPEPAAMFLSLLQDGQPKLARALLLELYLRGQSLAWIFDGVMAPALQALGELWLHDDAGIYLEHRAFDVCVQAVNQLRSLIPAPSGAPVAVGGSPAGDVYLMPSLMASAVCAEAGLGEVNLGAQVPLATLRAAAAHYGAKMVWLSCSCPRSRPDPAELSAFALSLSDLGAALVLGGQSRPDVGAAANILRADNMAQLGALAAGLTGG